MRKTRMPLTRLAASLLCLGLIAVPARAQETDPRLHSNGPGWRVEHAKIENDKLPRVLLIGDSILNGYMTGTIRALRGKANVDAWVNPYHQANGGLPKMVAGVMANGPYDIVHFNMGLHGLKPEQFKEGEFEPTTRQLVEAIRVGSPNAKLIWASTTPAMTGTKPNQLDPVANGVVLEHNRMAAKVMGEMGVSINDFYALLVDRLDLSSGDAYHWEYAGSDILSRKLVESVAADLKMNDVDVAAAFARIDEPEWTRANLRVDCGGAGDVRLELQGASENLKGILPSWAGEAGKLLLYTGTVTHEWEKYSLTFVPKSTGEVNLVIRGDCRLDKKIWTAYDDFSMEGAKLENGDIEDLDAQGKPVGWIVSDDARIGTSGDARGGVHFIEVSGTNESLMQKIQVEAGKPVTVTFYARIANLMKAK